VNTSTPDVEVKAQYYKCSVGGLHLNKEAKRELKVIHTNETPPFCSEPKYAGVILDRSLTYHRHLELLRKKVTSCIALLRRLAGSGWVAGAATLRAATLPLSIQQHITAFLSAATVLTPASLTLPKTTPCELWLDSCVLHKQTTSLFSRASNLLSFVAKEPHCL